MSAILPITIVSIKEFIRRKDFYVFLILLIVLLGVSCIQSFFQIEGISRYIRDVGYSLVILFSFLVAVTFSARQLPREIESHTIYPLLAKPISRRTVILCKFCASAVVSTISFLLLFLTFMFFDILKAGGMDPVLFLQSVVFGALFLCMICAVVIFFSTFMTFSANVTISILIYLIITGFSDSLRDFALYSKGFISYCSQVVYYLIPHFDFFNLRVRITHEWNALPFWVVAAVFVYTLIYCSFLIYLAGSIFGRKKL